MADPKPEPSKKGSDKPKKDDSKKDSAAKPSPAKPSSPGKKGAAPNMEERMEGVQGWMAEIEKKQQRNTRIGGIAVILALLAAAGALVLGVLNKQDAASESDVDALTEKVNELGSSVEQQTEKQLQGIGQRLSLVEQQLKSVGAGQGQTDAQITELKAQVADAVEKADAAAAEAKQKP